jgi:hypothetical protein
MNTLPSWNDLSEVEQLQCVYSDLHKDTYGFRPRNSTDEQWNSAEWLKQEIAWLDKEFDRVAAAEKEAELRNIAAFENTLQASIECGAGDRATALRWLKDAHRNADGSQDPYIEFDPGYFEYLHGLPYGYLAKHFA